MFLTCSILSLEMLIGGTSVSGYILAAPGRGLEYFEVPSGSGSLVSSGTPIMASFALSTAICSASAAFFSLAAQITNASNSPFMPRKSLSLST